MTEKVVSLRSGKTILAPGEICPAAVKLLEDLLMMARSGEIQGLVAFLAHSDGAIGLEYNEGLPITYNLVGRMLQDTNGFAEQASNRG